ncbi:alanine racemase [Cutibacterium sp. WCA-380-WT-3A]|uniref:Alanine racemase n=1 Tax=Cutibacterium porci TaxID=2605781 RepID=A0A7K0J3S8_9ACTN|nr:alanine racemase [Cutibacterium porci]MSS44590.1 alanine racemase [Cutibacterium porci]
MPRCPSPSHATIDLSAIAMNLTEVRKHAGDRKVLFAVKANAYGHGAVEVSRYVEKHGYADWLAVATVAEGQELIEAGITLPILKLSPADPWDMDAAITSGMRLTVLDFDTVDAVNRASTRLGITTKVHIAVDSGMGRIGLPPNRLAEVTVAADRADGIEVEGVFTHLPISDVPEGEEFTRNEIDTFMNAVSQVEADRGPFPLVHLANSGAILGHDLGKTSMVRAGIVGYGYDPDPHADRADLRPALSWISHVTFVKTIGSGDTVGYGRTWTASETTKIATVPVGYADGLSRGLSNKGHVLVGGSVRPIVGRICMDQFMIDLGPDSSVTVGDEVVLIGAQGDEVLTADDMAELLGTISYEITCAISKRVDRRWVGQ